MAGARGDALEWALALAAAPGERHALRLRPLPDGIDVLLQIAGGNDGPVMAEAMQRAGRSSAELVEAARFYLREVLFFPEADAYRVLGLDADAGDEQIKHHHRLLQQWLHPDRPASDWDAAFAARVNAAWSQLRTAERRGAYAASLHPVPSPDTGSEPLWVPAARAQPAHFEAGEHDDAGRWRRRAPVLALFGLCAVLGVMAVRDMQREPADGFVDAGVEDVDTEGGDVALHLPEQDEKAPAAAPAKARAVANATRAPAAGRQPPAKPEPGLNPLKRAVAALIAPSPPKTPLPVAARKAPAVAPAPPPVAATVPAMERREAKPALAIVQTSATPAPDIAREVPPPREAPPTVAKLHRAEPNAAVASPAVATHRTVATEAAAPAPAPTNTATARQTAQAEQTGQRLLAYVSGRRGGVPPIWANLTAQTQASRAREALQGAGRVSVGQPEWRIGDDTASMRASLAPREGAARNLRVDLIWREQQWLVSKLDLGS